MGEARGLAPAVLSGGAAAGSGPSAGSEGVKSLMLPILEHLFSVRKAALSDGTRPASPDRRKSAKTAYYALVVVALIAGKPQTRWRIGAAR